MHDEFIALRVPEGDAFFLRYFVENTERRILVDGGAGLRARYWANYNAPPESFDHLFKREIGPRPADSDWDVHVMVCTHNDRDHTEGLIEFLANGLRAREVWLPGSFAALVAQFAATPEHSLELLTQEVLAVPREQLVDLKVQSGDQEASLLELVEAAATKYEELQNSVSDAAIGPHADMHAYENAPVERISELLSLISPNVVFSTARFMASDYYRYGSSALRAILSDPLYVELFTAALQLGERVMALSALAQQSGARLRWFEFDSDGTPQSQDGEPYLRPLNARELSQVPPRSATMLSALTLTNKQSLVFHVPPTEVHPGVLFSADSNFDFGGPIPWRDGMLITAPHHGAGDNKRLAGLFNSTMVQRTIWVRSDGALAAQPSPTGNWVRPKSWFVHLNTKATLFCTHCNDAITRQSVRLHGNGTGWRATKTTKTCSCT